MVICGLPTYVILRRNVRNPIQPRCSATKTRNFLVSSYWQGDPRVATSTEQSKAIELSLQESEERFRNMANCAPVLLWMSGRDKLCDFFNQGWLTFTGRTMDQEIGNGWTQGVHPDDIQHCLETYHSAFD